MANIGYYKINTGKEYKTYTELTGETLEEGKLHIVQVQGGKIMAIMATETPTEGGFLVEQDEMFACTPKDGAQLYLKNVAATDVFINIAN